MSWPTGTIVQCVGDTEWVMLDGADSPDLDPSPGEYCTVESSHADPWMRSGVALAIVGYPHSYYDKADFRKVEGGTCESERARQMSEVRV